MNNDFLLGAFTMGALSVSVFFFRYFRASRDRLFLALASAFLLLAVERIVLQLVSPMLEGRHWIFLARLFAFLLIIGGILDKNRSARSRTEGDVRRFRLRRVQSSSL